MLNVIRSFSLQNRIVTFVSATELTELTCRLNVGVTLVDDAGKRFLLTGLASPRGGKQEIAVVLRAVDGHRCEPVGHLRSTE